MPANLSPEYKKAEQAYRQARDDGERLSCLKEMLRTIPKHKGTEHLQADLKRRIRQLNEELSGPRKGAARGGPVHTVRPEGAAQIALIGPPNAGKSSLHVRLTGSRTEVGPYPYTTREPVPGMLPWADIHFQLIDLPPVSAEHLDSWYAAALQPADAALLVVDIADPACTDQIGVVLRRLSGKRITLRPGWPADTPPAAEVADVDQQQMPDPFRIELPTLLVANRIDLNPDPDDVLVLQELAGTRFPALPVSALTGEGLDRIGPFLFERLAIVRVYTKSPGRPADMDRPFTVRCGATVLDVAHLVHKDLAGSLRYARAWGSNVFDGQQVGPEHGLCDGDVVELHIR